MLILIAEFAIAFAISLRARRALWRWLIGLVFPVVVALALSFPRFPFRGESDAVRFLGFVVLLVGGLAAAGFGSVFGYLVARGSTRR